MNLTWKLWATKLGVIAALLMVTPAWAQVPRVVVAVSRSVFTYPLLFAQQNNFFEAEGVEVEFRDCPSGAACMALMLDGHAQLALAADLPIAVRAHDRPGLAVLATIGTSRTDLKLIGRAAAKLGTTAGLRAARIGVPVGTSAHYFADMVYTLHGIQHGARKLVNLPPAGLGKALLEGKVDGVTVWEPYASGVLEAMGSAGEVVDVEPMYTESFNLITRQQHLPQLGEAVVRLLRAVDRAARLSRLQPRLFLAFVQQHLALGEAQAASLMAHFKFEVALTQGLLSTLEAQGKWARSRNLTAQQEAPSYLDIIAPAPLRAMRPSAVSLVK